MSNFIENFHIIKAIALPATNHKGTRVKLFSQRFKQSVTIPATYGTKDAAIAWLKSNGHKVIGQDCTHPDYDLFICEGENFSFKPLKEVKE